MRFVPGAYVVVKGATIHVTWSGAEPELVGDGVRDGALETLAGGRVVELPLRALRGAALEVGRVRGVVGADRQRAGRGERHALRAIGGGLRGRRATTGRPGRPRANPSRRRPALVLSLEPHATAMNPIATSPTRNFRITETPSFTCRDAGPQTSPARGAEPSTAPYFRGSQLKKRAARTARRHPRRATTSRSLHLKTNACTGPTGEGITTLLGTPPASRPRNASPGRLARRTGSTPARRSPSGMKMPERKSSGRIVAFTMGGAASAFGIAAGQRQRQRRERQRPDQEHDEELQERRPHRERAVVERLAEQQP